MNRSDWLLQHYAQVAQFAEAMLEAARHERWDELVDLEQKRASLVAELMAEKPHDAIPADVAEKIKPLIQAILEKDAESSARAQAWREELKALLGSIGAERKISKAYGQ